MNISVFDIFKIGIGPSSSHTMGPWIAAKDFINFVVETPIVMQYHSSITDTTNSPISLNIELTGSLAKTGKGHATDVGVILGLLNEDPSLISPSTIQRKIETVYSSGVLSSINNTGKSYIISFDPKKDIVFNKKKVLPYHSNGLICTMMFENRKQNTSTYYSIGGGFVEKEVKPDCTIVINSAEVSRKSPPFLISSGKDLQKYSDLTKKSIADIVLENEIAWNNQKKIDSYIVRVSHAMLESIYEGCHSEGELPGGLFVRRRAYDMCRRLMQQNSTAYSDIQVYNKMDNQKAMEQILSWFEHLSCGKDFINIMDWVICFALAVNETNAASGRVVTAPTNGAAGVIPAVFAYFMFLLQHKKKKSFNNVRDFFLTASVIGALFKKNATISAAAGGCQAEIGVSSAMAAAGLTTVTGGSTKQVLMAAEIAMEHHLGLTCDPIRGLVQIPCIERNSMGAIKAITASQIALSSNPNNAIVHLDDVINTMWEIAQAMNDKYKETAEGGLATNVKIQKRSVRVSVNLPEC